MSKLKIYGVPASRTFRVLWCANELGLDYELVPTHFADQTSKTPEYLAINPNGKIPAIEDGELKLWESMAINCYLAKKHGSGLWPKTPEDEAKVLQWSLWVMTLIEAPLLTLLMQNFALPPAERDAEACEAAEEELQAPLKVLDAALVPSGYLVGRSFSLADLNVAGVLSWAKPARLDLSAFPHVARWLDAALARPAAAKALPRRG
jgi:glutathione S-transferase